ncbi:MAG: hypothetical protein KAJ03_04275 [Gammaproteobacteria bacterium]|nr:hypothetical protein [Gammaproteobacteria bacterium]
MMDKTLEYVKMCRKAQEIQEQWKFERGDYFTTLRSVKHGYAHCIVDAFWFDDQSRNTRPAPWVWLPLQHQLQDMVVQHNVDTVTNYIYNAYFILHDFAAWFNSWENSGMMDVDSREKITLCWVMHVVHGKVWTGSEWVKA